MYGDLGALAWLRYLGDSRDRRSRVRACALHREGVKTPLHPAAFKYQVAQDELLRQKLAAEKKKRHRIGQWVSMAWCTALTAATLNTITHHGFGGMPVIIALVCGRILVAAVL